MTGGFSVNTWMPRLTASFEMCIRDRFRIYTEAFTYSRMGYASAIAYFLFLIVLVITIIQ